jgi:hypothetical protein
MKHKSGLLIVLVIFTLACNLVNIGADQPGGENDPAPAENPLLPFSASATPVPTSIPSQPVGLRQGLASLNSYRLEIRTINNGPTADDRNEITMRYESDSDGESWHLSNAILISTAEEPGVVETNQTDQYKVGNNMCEVSEDGSEAEETDVDPQAQEITDVWLGLFDMVPVISNPTFIGTEILNGVETNHFRFSVSGLGATSGAEVVASEGEYWLAVDGQYIVRYTVRLETRDGPAGDANTHTMRSEVYIEVKDINQPIVITLPAFCR